MKKRDEKQSFNGLRKIKRFLAAVEIGAMLFEFGITPGGTIGPLFVSATEEDVGIETVENAPQETAADNQSEPSGGESNGEGEAGNSAEEQGGSSAENDDSDKNESDSQGADTEGSTGNESEKPTDQAGASEVAAGSDDKQEKDTTGEASGEDKKDEVTASTEEKQTDAATGASSTEEKKTDAATGASSIDGKKTDAATGASSTDGKQTDAATGASSTEEKKTDAATGASNADKLTDKAATGISGIEETEKEEKEREAIEGELSADDSVWLSFGTDAGIPEGSEVKLEEIGEGSDDYDYCLNTAMEISGLASEQIAGLKVVGISIMNEEEEIEPRGSVAVEMRADYLFGEGALYADDEVTVVHISGDEGEALSAEVITWGDEEGDDGASEGGDIPEAYTRKGDAVRFSTESFSSFVFIQSVNEKTVAATDESSYVATAIYDNVSGIPAGTAFTVNEISQDSDEMARMYEESAALFDEEIYSVETIRAFDLSFVNMESGDEYQPEKDVSLSLQLIDNGFLEGAEINLIRFDEAAEIVDAGIDLEQQILSFGTSSMSVYAVVQLAVKKELTASDGSTYSVKVNYDSVSGIPEGVSLAVTEISQDSDSFDEYAEKSAEEVEDIPGTVKIARAFDISFVNPETGEVYEPTKPIQVSLELLDEDVESCESLDIVHISDNDGTETELLDSTVNDGQIEFEAESFSVYVVVKTVKAKDITASDGEEYRITVIYDADAGIPADAELKVTEIYEGDEKYQEYMEKNAEALDSEPSYFAMSRAFDISLINPRTGEEYQPDKDVKVRIELLKDDLEDYLGVNVVHLPEGDEAEVIDSVVEDGNIEFSTDGFSVYVLTGNTYLGEYYFYAYNNFGEYVSYHFTDDNGNQVDKLVIKNGEKLTAPHDTPKKPNDNSATFNGWYIGTGDSANPNFGNNPQPFDFDAPQNLTGDEKLQRIDLYAVFSTYANITFHGKQDTSGDFPVLNVRRVELTANTVTEDIRDVKAPDYDEDVSGTKKHKKFMGWGTNSENPENYKIDHPEAFQVSGNVDLYPIFKEVHYLTFNSGPSGSGATYYSPYALEVGGALDQTKMSTYLPQRPGYVFAGWYLSVTAGDADPYGTGTQLTEADGTLKQYVNGQNIQTADDGQGGTILRLSSDANVYAGWTAKNDVKYYIVAWKQRVTDAAVAPEDMTWDCVETFELTGTAGSSVSVEDNYKQLVNLDKYNEVHDPDVLTSPFTGYIFNEAKSDTASKTIAGDGSTVFYIYYVKDTAAPAYGIHNLTFDLPQKKPDGTTDTGLNDFSVTFNVTSTSSPSIEEVIAANPGTVFPVTISEGKVSPVIPENIEGYEYNFYADSVHTTRLFFDEASYNKYTGGKKVLYETMPCSDLTVYLDWEEIWYLIRIDPNLGSLNGQGSTYFWKTYKSDYIQEYTKVTRDFVESESGEYYYVNHDYDYYSRYPAEDDKTKPYYRQTGYDKDISKATSLKTYRRDANSPYKYDGWYQVNEDGTETPYQFGGLITGNVTLKLHWRIDGTYYLKYNTDVTTDGVRLKGSLIEEADTSNQETIGYEDQADILIHGRAQAPDGYTFVGWTIRGDDSGKVYYPGKTFALPGERAVTVNSKKTVYLDAVYKQIETAKIIYDANGGNISNVADAGFPCDANGAVLAGNNSTVTRDLDKKQVTLSGLVNNSRIRLSSGAGFTSPTVNAEFSGWNTEPDGSGKHYEKDSYQVTGGTETGPYFVDIKEPVTLYAEWKVKVSFDKNANAYIAAYRAAHPGASDPVLGFDANWGTDYTWDATNQRYYIESYYNAIIKEPAGKATVDTGEDFDFWSKNTDGGQEHAFNFGKEKLEGNLILYAHFTDAKKVPYHVASTNKVSWDDSWRNTNFLRINGVALVLDTATPALNNYLTPEDGYRYSYACLSDSPANIPGNIINAANNQKIKSVIVDANTSQVTVTLADDTSVTLDANGKDANGREIYLVYSGPNGSPILNVKYIKEGDSGAMSAVAGAGEDITYDGNAFNALNAALVTDTVLNNATVADTQSITLKADGTPLEISQSVADDVFNAPPLLDGGANNKRSLVFDSFGVRTDAAAVNPLVKSSIDISDTKMYLRYHDGRNQWSKDKLTWTTFNGDTLYVMYRPKGYQLTITKAVTPANTGISRDETFEVKISSDSITRTSYKVEGTGYSTIAATPAAGGSSGEIKLTVKDGSEVIISGLTGGNYNVLETVNSNYKLKAWVNNVEQANPSNGINLLALSADTTIRLENESQVICQIWDGGYQQFNTLNKALEYVQTHNLGGVATIQMLLDYVMPDWDVLEIPAGYDITIESAGNGSYSIRRNENQSTDNPIFNNKGKLTLKTITITGAPYFGQAGTGEIDARSPLIQNEGEGELIIDNGAKLVKAKMTGGNGGAICQNSGTLTIKAGAELSNNTAKNGGAVYVNSGVVNISGGKLSSNATSQNGGALYYAGSSNVTITGGEFSTNKSTENGGAIYSEGGSISVSGATINANTANKGGGVYSASGTVSVSSGTVFGNTADVDGGGIYAGTGTVSISGGATATIINANIATGGNGGGIYTQSGKVIVSGGSLKNNTAANGNGGAVYIDTGNYEMSNGSVGAASAPNSAKNGAGVFVNTGIGTFTGGSITYNTASVGGAVGVGSENARLNFSNNINVKNNTNTVTNAASNVYLDKDADNIINIKGLGNSSALGIYVADSVATKRGIPGAKFATYTSNNNSAKITNDRYSFSVVSETSAKKLYWGKAIKVEVRYQSGGFADNFPPNDTGYQSIKTIDKYYPVMGDDGYVAMSVLAEDLKKNQGVTIPGTTTAVYGGAFSNPAGNTYDDYVTKLTWDSANSKWQLVKHDDSTKVDIDTSTLIVYFAEPAYITIENNTDMQLTISNLTIKAGTIQRSVINTNTGAAGYGMLYAKNGALCTSLLPVKAEDLVLDAEKTVNLMIPGGRNMEYTLEGTFAGYTGTAPLFRRTQLNDESGKYELQNINLDVSAVGSFTAPEGGKTRNDNGTHQIIFGKDREICRVRTPKIDNATSEYYLYRTDADSAGNIEYVFKSLNQAMTFVTTFMYQPDKKKAEIEMLTDYLLPYDDNLFIPRGYDITLSTAEEGEYKYPSDVTGSNRATISRDSANTVSMINAWDETIKGLDETTLTLKNLIFDGKGITGTSDGGVVYSKYVNVYVNNVDFKNSNSKNGGALMVMYHFDLAPYTSRSKSVVPDSELNVVNSNFYNCESTADIGGRLGGGAIVTNAQKMVLDSCKFDSCNALDQAGAAFHRIDGNYESYGIIRNCTFTNCTANAAGGLELDSKYITVEDCTFEHCVARDRNGGGFNAFMTNSTDPDPDNNNCQIKVLRCTFNDCHQTNNNKDNYGGAFRSTAVYTTIVDCHFTNTKGKQGGAVGISNKKALKVEVYGCTINDVLDSKLGGGIFSRAKEMIISDSYQVDANNEPVFADSKAVSVGTHRVGDMIISNCMSEIGGGVYQDRDIKDSSLTITNAVIRDNTVTATATNVDSSGGGVYTNARMLTVTGSTISGNKVKLQGGGIYSTSTADDATIIIDNTVIKDNQASNYGAGVYCKCPITIRKDTSITGNRLTSSSAGVENAAGVYLEKPLTIGTTDAPNPEKIVIMNNKTASGADSDLLLEKDIGQSYHTATSVEVLCSLSDDSVIRVINPKGIGEQFGTRTSETFTGFTEGKHAFVSDSGALYGVYNRNDTTKLIWRGGAICKITDANGHILYLDEACTDPAVFDRLDYRGDGGDGGDRLSPFSYLRQSNEEVKLYRKDDAGGTRIDLTKQEIQIKMLVSNYETETYIFTGNYSDRKQITLTTAASSDTDGYPYTGSPGTYATIIRKYADNNDQPLIKTGVNFALKNITIDGGAADKTTPKVSETNGGLISAAVAGTTVKLMANSVLQNCTITAASGKNGAGVFVDNGVALKIEGGAIYNCNTEGGNGGGVYKAGNGNIEFSSGIISRCSAQNGGGVYLTGGVSSFTMSGSAQITGCTALDYGGGVWVGSKNTMVMTGGSVTSNKAKTAGGGIYLTYDKDTRFNLSGRVIVSGNTFTSDGKACNVQLGTKDNNPDNNADGSNDWNGIINSAGIARNSFIGIYVPGDESPGNDPVLKDTTVFDRHGIKTKKFGKYTGDSAHLYCFVNDRNGLKGGIQNNDAHIYWVEIFSIKVAKTVISSKEEDLKKDFRFKVTLKIGYTEDSSQKWNEFSTTTYPLCYFTYDDKYDGKVDSEGNPKTVDFTDGVAEFTLRTNESITVNNLPAELENGYKIFYQVEEVFLTSQENHFMVSTSRSTKPNPKSSTGEELFVHGRVGENLNENTESKYVSNAYFDNIDGICKLTSSKNGGVLLYSRDDATGKLVPAIYTALHNAEGKGAFDIVNNMGASGSPAMYYWNAFTNKYETYETGGSDTLSVEMLITSYDPKAGGQVTVDSGKTVTFTTADPQAKDGFPYVGTGSTSTITRLGGIEGGQTMFTVNGNLTLKNICLDGNNKEVTKRILDVTGAGSSLTIEKDTTIQNSISKEDGGAINVNNKGTLIMNGGTIKNNTAKRWGGGAIRIESSGGNVTINDGEISGNQVVSTGNDSNGGAISVRGGNLTIKGGIIKNNKAIANTKCQGGAIYVESKDGKCTLTLSGGTIAGNEVQGNASGENKAGAGIYIASNDAVDKRSVLYISGNPKFELVEGGNTLKNTLTMTGYDGKKNGGENVYTGNVVRQDIYLAETANDPTSIQINGDLTGEAGSIWVWTVKDTHYKVSMPFAKFAPGTVYADTPSTGQFSGSHLKVFRNAQDDVTTQNQCTQTPPYLYGVLKVGDSSFAYWCGVEGMAHVILSKVQKSGDAYKPLDGKTFTVYTSETETDDAYVAKGKVINSTSGELEDFPLKNMTSGDGGAFFIGDIPYGKYYVREDGVSDIFKISINKDGVFDLSKGESTDPSKTVDLTH